MADIWPGDALVRVKGEREELRKRVEALEAQRDEALKALDGTPMMLDTATRRMAEARRILSGGVEA